MIGESRPEPAGADQEAAQKDLPAREAYIDDYPENPEVFQLHDAEYRRSTKKRPQDEALGIFPGEGTMRREL